MVFDEVRVEYIKDSTRILVGKEIPGDRENDLLS